MSAFKKLLSYRYAGQKTGRAEWIILATWMLVNSLFLWKHGIVTYGEADKYISQAHVFLQSGHLDSANYWLYFLQIALLSFCLKIHLGFGGMAFIQLLTNLLATLYFFRTILYLFHSKTTALLSTLLLLLNLPYQEFNVYLQTESLFQSLSLLFSCYLMRIEKFTISHLAQVVLFLLILSVTRPNGLLYLPAAFAFIWLVTHKEISPAGRIGLLVSIPLLLLFLLQKVMGSGGEWDFLLPFREEHIICGTPTLLSQDRMAVAGKGSSLIDLLSYILHHFKQFTRLALLKSGAFWGLYRPYFSFLHNFFLAACFYPLVGLAFSGIGWWRKNLPVRCVYLCSLILLTWLTVILTCDDWHNRIYLSISPYLIILATPVLKKIIHRDPAS